MISTYPITPAMFKQRMNEVLAGVSDPTERKINADALMRATLLSMGYREGLEVYLGPDVI